jgi:hypothetical protein
MTDKVQKIREFLIGIAEADGVSTILAKAIEKKILPYIDSMQEEPKKCMYSLDDFNDEDRKVTCDGCEEDCKYNKKETVNDKLGGINNAIIQDKLIWQNNIKHDCSFCSMPDCVGRNSSAKDNCLLNRKKEPSIPDIVDEHFYEMLGEEPVSEEVEKVAKYYIPDESYHMVIESEEGGSGENVYDYVQMINMFKAGARWQKEQTMANAIDGTARPDDNEI